MTSILSCIESISDLKMIFKKDDKNTNVFWPLKSDVLRFRLLNFLASFSIKSKFALTHRHNLTNLIRWT